MSPRRSLRQQLIDFDIQKAKKLEEQEAAAKAATQAAARAVVEAAAAQAEKAAKRRQAKQKKQVYCGTCYKMGHVANECFLTHPERLRKWLERHPEETEVRKRQVMVYYDKSNRRDWSSDLS